MSQFAFARSVDRSDTKLYILERIESDLGICNIHTCICILKKDGEKIESELKTESFIGLKSEYEEFEGCPCIIKAGAKQLCFLTNCEAEDFEFSVVQTTKLKFAKYCVFESNVFDAENGAYRAPNLSASTILAFRMFVFQEKLLKCTSAIQTFVKQPLKKVLPEIGELQSLFKQAFNPDDMKWKDVKLFDESVHQDSVVYNVFKLISNCTAAKLNAWPMQSQSTAAVGGGMLHLGLTLAFRKNFGNNDDKRAIHEQRCKHYCESATPLQLCLLNSTINTLLKTYKFSIEADIVDDGNAVDASADEDEEDETDTLGALPFIASTNLKITFKCVDDLSTLKLGDFRTSLEIKTKWKTSDYQKLEVQRFFWQSAIQAFVSTTQSAKPCYPSLLIIEVPAKYQITETKMHLSEINVKAEPLLKTIKMLLRTSYKLSPFEHIFCNGRVLIPLTQDIFEKFCDSTDDIKVFRIGFGSERVPLVRLVNATTQDLALKVLEYKWQYGEFEQFFELDLGLRIAKNPFNYGKRRTEVMWPIIFDPQKGDNKISLFSIKLHSLFFLCILIVWAGQKSWALMVSGDLGYEVGKTVMVRDRVIGGKEEDVWQGTIAGYNKKLQKFIVKYRNHKNENRTKNELLAFYEGAEVRYKKDKNQTGIVLESDVDAKTDIVTQINVKFKGKDTITQFKPLDAEKELEVIPSKQKANRTKSNGAEYIGYVNCEDATDIINLESFKSREENYSYESGLNEVRECIKNKQIGDLQKWLPTKLKEVQKIYDRSLSKTQWHCHTFGNQ